MAHQKNVSRADVTKVYQVYSMRVNILQYKHITNLKTIQYAYITSISSAFVGYNMQEIL